MPVVTVQQSSGRTMEQKQLLMQRISEAFKEAYKIPPESVTVFFSEYDENQWGKAGCLASKQTLIGS